MCPAVLPPAVEVSSRELTGACFGAGGGRVCVPYGSSACLISPAQPSTTSLPHWAFFSLSLEVSLLLFQSGCWNIPPISGSLLCTSPRFNRREFLQTAGRELPKQLTAPSASSPGTLKSIFPSDSSKMTLSQHCRL